MSSKDVADGTCPVDNAEEDNTKSKELKLPTSRSRASSSARAASSLRSYLLRSPTRAFLQLHLLFISFTTGLLDASTYSDYGIFASNQTGNSIILLVEAMSSVRRVSSEERTQKDTLILTVGVSLASFLAFGTLFGQIAARLDCKTARGWLLLSTFIQAVLLLLPAVLLQAGTLKLHHLSMASESGSESTGTGTTDTHSARVHDAVSIFLLAASAGMQVAMSRSLSIPEIPTAMMTSVYADIIIDPNLFTLDLWTKKVKSRNMRFCYVFMLAMGTIVGALVWIYRGSAAVLWVAFALRLGNVALIACAPEAKTTKGHSDREGTIERSQAP